MDSDALTVVLVHHADAVGPEVDPQRPLSTRGISQAAWLANQTKLVGLMPSVIWHSGKLRARQTANEFWRVCNPQAEIKMLRGLRPEDPPDWARDALEAEHGIVLLVSHMPLLPALIRRLAPESEGFPLHGLVVLERTGLGRYVEQRRILQIIDV